MYNHDDDEEPMTDAQLKRRTEALLQSAERVSQQLTLQTERLALAIEVFDREIITPLREGLSEYGG
mgnify:CR=1 FL=1